MSGFLVGIVSPSELDQAYIHFVGVCPQARNNGLARTLYDEFFQIARSHNRRVVKAVTSPASQASKAFHRCLGFAVSGPTSDYNGSGRDLVINEPRSNSPAGFANIHQCRCLQRFGLHRVCARITVRGRPGEHDGSSFTEHGVQDRVEVGKVGEDDIRACCPQLRSGRGTGRNADGLCADGLGCVDVTGSVADDDGLKAGEPAAEAALGAIEGVRWQVRPLQCVSAEGADSQVVVRVKAEGGEFQLRQRIEVAVRPDR